MTMHAKIFLMAYPAVFAFPQCGRAVLCATPRRRVICRLCAGVAPFAKVLLVARAAFLPFPGCSKTVGFPAPGVVVAFRFLLLMAVDAPVKVVMAPFAVILVVIKFASMSLYPARILMFDPAVFMVERHAVVFYVFVAHATRQLLCASLFMARDAVAKHIRDKPRLRNVVTLLYMLVALITLHLVFKVYLVCKF